MLRRSYTTGTTDLFTLHFHLMEKNNINYATLETNQLTLIHDVLFHF